MAAVALGWMAASVPTLAEFNPGRAGFELRVNGKPVLHREFFRSLMPDEILTLEVEEARDSAASSDFSVMVDDSALESEGPGHWKWTAPSKAGHHQLLVQGPEESVELRVFVLRPLTDKKDGYLDGYRIGDYPSRPRQGNPIYKPPAGLIEVTEDMVDLPVSPHFTLGQFLCKQQPDHWPKYLALREPLVTKLEVLLEAVNRSGIETNGFHVMSGYRTPWYNRSIGNGRYSRHVWGGAADIFVDTSGNGRMDDLTGNGKSGYRDARVLRRIAQDTFGKSRYRRYRGGLGLYGPRSHRGPFLHVDARGEEARWEYP